MIHLSLAQGGNDEDISPCDKSNVPEIQGAITRARAKKFKEELNLFIFKLFNQNMSPNEEFKMVNVLGVQEASLGLKENSFDDPRSPIQL